MATGTKKRNVEHVGLAGNVMLCDRCGARQELTLPQPVGSVAALLKAWTTAHARCIGNTTAFRQAATLGVWPQSDDTGASSKAIYRHMTHGIAFPELHGGVAFPHDPDDFGRCYRLLQLAPHWRARIGEMARHGPQWAALADAWDELSALYEEEIGPSHRGSAPKLYARMKELASSVSPSTIPGKR